MHSRSATESCDPNPSSRQAYRKHVLLLAMLLLAIGKLWLVHDVPLSALGNADHDDRLFLRLADSLRHGEWLGRYDEFTLIKGPVYPIWLACNASLGLPLLLSQHALYLFAGLVLIHALRPVLPNLLTGFLVFATFALNVEMIPRVVRGGIYIPLTVLVLAGLIGMHVSLQARLWKLGGWACCTGLALSAFWLTREEGLWLLPSILLMLVCALFSLYRRYGRTRHFVTRATLCLLPFLFLWLSHRVVSHVNKNYYGTHAVVEIVAKPFTSAYGALARVKHASPVPRVALPRE